MSEEDRVSKILIKLLQEAVADLQDETNKLKGDLQSLRSEFELLRDRAKLKTFRDYEIERMEQSLKQ